MENTIAAAIGPNRMHKPDDQELADAWELSADERQKERLTEFDHSEAAILGMRLAADDCFQAKTRKVAAAADARERREIAEREAKPYTREQGPHRAEIVRYLLELAALPDHPSVRRDYFANRARKAVWLSAPLGPLDPRRCRARWERLEFGVTAVARFGAGRCIHCGADLAGGLFAGSSGRRARRTHCRAHEGVQSIVESESDAMRQAFDASVGRRKLQRANRRAA